MPEFFNPARSTRHRIACFALYKALLRQGARVPLPDSLAPVPAELASSSGSISPISPIKRVIRRSFRQNRSDTSSRLVSISLENGYKFLNLLSKARRPDSPEHDSIVAFIEKNRDKFATWAAAEARNKDIAEKRRMGLAKAGRVSFKTTNSGNDRNKKTRERFTLPSAPLPGTIPLLTRREVATGDVVVSQQQQQQETPIRSYSYYDYVPTDRPRPLEVIQANNKDAKRKVPVFATEATGFPFLRMSNTQSPLLSRVLRQKGLKRRLRMAQTSELQVEGVRFAQLEDDWEKVVAKTLTVKEERMPDSGVLPAEDTTYVAGVRAAVDYLTVKLNIEMEDMLARSRALLRIVDEEKALAEAEERQSEPNRESQEAGDGSRPDRATV